MGISAVCANLKTSLMHAYKAGVIHLLMCPQPQQYNLCVAQRTGMMSTRKTSCFPSAKVTRFWRSLVIIKNKKQKTKQHYKSARFLKSALFMLWAERIFTEITLKVQSLDSFGENTLNFNMHLFWPCTFFKLGNHFQKKKKFHVLQCALHNQYQ